MMEEEHSFRCCVCGSILLTVIKGVFDTRFGINEHFDIYECNSCDLIQLPPYYSGKNLKNLYEMYYNFGGNKKGLYTKIRKRFLESILYRLWMRIDGDISFHSKRGQGRLLDLGCNEGRGLKIYQQNGFTAEGLELNETAAEEARKAGFRIYADPLEQFEPERLYDVVVLSNVIEHSLDPKDMLNQVNRVLEPGGQVWISCPNVESWQRDIFGRYWINWHVPFHITFFSARTLKSLLNEGGFEIKKIKCVTPGLWTAQSMIAKLFAQKGKKNYAQRSPILLGFLIVFVRFIFFPLLWLGNLLGRGDCLIIEAQKKQAIS